jgi:hypothetical protein
MPTIVCPQCENDSSIQRVSAVVASGISTGSFSGPTGAITFSDGKVGSAGGYTTLSGGSSTELAKMLALPMRHQKVFSNSCSGITLIILMLMLFFAGIMIVLTSLQNGGGDVECFLPIGIVTLLSVTITVIAMSNRDKRIESTEWPYWEKYKASWDKLYYCHKHGIVIDPETGKTCEPAQIKDFVNELIKDQIIKPPSITGESL